jgi:hypothetical protein
MIEAILAIMAVLAYFGGVATKDFIRPALPGRKQQAITSTIEPKINPFQTDIAIFNGINPWPVWAEKRNKLYYASKIDVNTIVRDERKASQQAPKWKASRDSRRDVKLYERMVKLHNDTNDPQARAAVVVMWQNHLLPAYLVNEKADGAPGANKRYDEIMDLIEENLEVIEVGYHGSIELEQQQMINHLKEVRAALKPPAIDQNLDLSKPAIASPASRGKAGAGKK